MALSSVPKIVDLVCKLFAKYPDQRFNRLHVCAILNKAGYYVTLSDLTYHWRTIEQWMAQQYGMYTFRSKPQWFYTVGATTDPIYPRIEGNSDERYILTMVQNRLLGGNITRLAKAGDLQSALRQQRYKTYIGMISTHELSLEIASLMASLKMLPMAPPTAKLIP